MKQKRTFGWTLAALTLCAAMQVQTLRAQGAQDARMLADRRTTLLGARNMEVTTTDNKTYYYLVSNDATLRMELDETTVNIGGDPFETAKIKGMRFKTIPRYVMDEDSVTFDKTMRLSGALVAFRTAMQVGKWTALCVPFTMTGAQILDTFGEETRVASVRGVKEDDLTTIEFELLDLQTNDVVIEANYHYLLCPSREPDLVAGRTLSQEFNGVKPQGPLYLIPTVTMDSNQSPRIVSVHDDDRITSVRLKGTYLKLDNSVTTNLGTVRNRNLQIGTYSFDDEGVIHRNEQETDIKAFRWWIENMGDTETLRFVISGDTEEELGDMADAILPTLAGQDREADTAVFDLSGRRLAGSLGQMGHGQLKPGIYIVNGKKVIIK